MLIDALLLCSFLSIYPPPLWRLSFRASFRTGVMDNFVMLSAGDLIDNTLGVKFGLATLTAAACGQVVKNTGNFVHSRGFALFFYFFFRLHRKLQDMLPESTFFLCFLLFLGGLTVYLSLKGLGKRTWYERATAVWTA